MSLCFSRITFVHVMRVCDSTLKNPWEMTFLFMMSCYATITLVILDDIDKTENIVDFLDVSSIVSLFSGSQNELLYFVKVTKKGTAQKDLTDTCGHFIGNGERF